MAKTIKIHKFDPIIYPLKLYVVVTDNHKFINENFTDCNNEEINNSLFESTNAFVVRAIHKETNKFCILVIFTKKSNITIKIMCHEAYHAMDIYAHFCGFDYEPGLVNEPQAYLCGWVAQCLNIVRTYKEQK